LKSERKAAGKAVGEVQEQDSYTVKMGEVRLEPAAVQCVYVKPIEFEGKAAGKIVWEVQEQDGYIVKMGEARDSNGKGYRSCRKAACFVL
jgi:hypothetical protein